MIITIGQLNVLLNEMNCCPYIKRIVSYHFYPNREDIYVVECDDGIDRRINITTEIIWLDSLPDNYPYQEPKNH